MTIRQLIHCVALLVTNVIAFRIGTAWDIWTHQRHPSAVQIPMGAITAVVAFLVGYHVINALDACRWQLRHFRQWRLLYIVTAVLGGVAMCLVPNRVCGEPFSKGRLAGFAIYQLLTNVIVIAIAVPQQSFDSHAYLRQLLTRRWFRRTLAASGISMLVLLGLGTVEGVCYVLNNTKTAGPKKVYEGEYLKNEVFSKWDDNLGTTLVPNADVSCRLKVDHTTVWDVRYSTDEFGRRTTIHQQQEPERYVIFFGCSFLFGEGSNDDQTIPSQFSAAAPAYRAYNYGVPGYGTQQMLAKLETGTVKQEIPERKGIAVYLYLEDVHEPRTIGGMQVTNSFAWNFPYYDLDADGNLKRFGSLSSGRPVTSRLYWLLGKSQFVRTMGMNFPRPRDDHYRLVAEITAESKRLCLDQLGCEDFYVVYYPKQNSHKRVLEYFDKAEIKYFDYSDLFNPDDAEFNHIGDGHPTPKANQVIARRLATDLSVLEKATSK